MSYYKIKANINKSNFLITQVKEIYQKYTN